jgi:hypothetical protein
MNTIQLLSKMKFLLLSGVLLMSSFSIAQRRSGAQVSISVNVNTDREASLTRYYYYPDYNVYYDCSDRVFIGFSGGRWLRNVAVDFEFDTAIYVSLDFRGRDPYCENAYHRRTYCRPVVVYEEDCRHKGKGKGHKKHKKHHRHHCDD